MSLYTHQDTLHNIYTRHGEYPTWYIKDQVLESLKRKKENILRTFTSPTHTLGLTNVTRLVETTRY